MLRYWDMQTQTEYEHGYKGYVTIKEVFGKGVSKLESCINFYNYNKEMLLKDVPIVRDRTTEVQYEYFVQHPREELKRLYGFTGLDWYDELEKDVPSSLELENNSKWRSLPPEKRQMLGRAFPHADAVAA
jgi:hypothetical protein